MWLHRHAAKLSERVSKVTQIIDAAAVAHTSSKTDRLLIERAVMQLQIEWDAFVRKLILDSALGNFSDSSGRVYSQLPRPPRSRGEASRVLTAQYKKKSVEPDWYDTAQAIDAAGKLKLSNYGKIAGVLGVTPWLINDLRWVRNFIAHPSERSALKIRGFGIVPAASQIDVVACALDYDSTGQPRYKTWGGFISLVGWQLIK